MASKRTRVQAETVTPERLAVDALFQMDADLRAAVTENLATRLSEASDVAARVEQGWQLEPSRLSADERGRRHYVPAGTDPGEVMRTVVRQGVDALRSSRTEHTLTLRAGAELDALVRRGKSSDSDGGVIALGSLIDLITSKHTGTVVHAPPAANRRAAETEADSILGAIERGGSEPSVSRSAATAGAGDTEAGELVDRAVNLQMETATSPETQLSYRTIPNRADDDEGQQRILQTFELRPGASDVTSYHDFHTLQVAFEHVWTEIFDGQLDTLGRALYREYVKLKVFVQSDDDDLEVSTLADLHRLLAEIRRLGQIVTEESPPAVREIVENGGRPGGIGGDDGWKAAVGVATGGVSYLFEWALQQFSQLGRKPIIRWADFPGPWPPRQDRIEVSFSASAPAGSVEIELRTDPDSHLKIIEFEPWDEPSKRFLHGPAISNAGHHTRVTLSLTTAQVAAGVLEFLSEETPGNNPGRYVLSDLPEKLVDGTRVTFYWKDL